MYPVDNEGKFIPLDSKDDLRTPASAPENLAATSSASFFAAPAEDGRREAHDQHINQVRQLGGLCTELTEFLKNFKAAYQSAHPVPSSRIQQKQWQKHGLDSFDKLIKRTVIETTVKNLIRFNTEFLAKLQERSELGRVPNQRRVCNEYMLKLENINIKGKLTEYGLLAESSSEPTYEIARPS